MGMGRTGARARGRTRPRRTAALLLALAMGASACGQPEEVGAPPEGTPPTAAATVPPTTDPTTSSSGTTGSTEDDMDPDDETTAGPPPAAPPAGAADLPDDPAGAELVLEVSGTGGRQPPVTLSCDFATGTATGTHPQAQQACTDLRAAVRSGDPFAPVPPDALCTQQFGGEAVVEVSGAVLAADGGPVDVQARFSLTDGCEISRWEAMGAVLAPYRGDV